MSENRCLMETIDIREKKWIGHVIKGNSLVNHAMEGRLEGKKPRGRPRTNLWKRLMKDNNYGNLKLSLDRQLWKTY